MKAGNLVEIQKASHDGSVPAKTVALILNKVRVNNKYSYFTVQLIGGSSLNPLLRRRRYVAEDLKVIS